MKVPLAGIDFMCINTAYKQEGTYDLVIVDEAHRALSPKYRRVFSSIKSDNWLCLTATLPHLLEYEILLAKYAPVVYQKTVLEGIESKALSQYRLVNVACGWDADSKRKYGVFDRLFNEAAIQLTSINRYLPNPYASAFDMAKYCRSSADPVIAKYAKQFWMAMQNRKSAVYSNKEKTKVAAEIVSKYPDKKWILFYKTISEAEYAASLLGGRVYHSKLKKAEREAILAEFKSGAFKTLVAVDALNEGFNVPDVDAAICVSGVSVELVAIQQLGRVIRFKEGKEALFINLYTKDSVEHRWTEAKSRSLNPVWVEHSKEIQWC